MIVELNEQNFESQAGHGLKLIEFYTTWCVFCKNQRIELEELKDSEMWIGIVDADECPNLVQKYQVKGFPTFVLLKDGIKITEFAGFHKKSQLLDRLMAYLK